jgi:activating signal cointegrator 1
MKIKAISLWQPWASLIAAGVKKYETRSWKTDYRGPLLICAAKLRLSFDVLMRLGEDPKFRDSLFHRTKDVMDWVERVREYLPYGEAVAIASLTRCIKTENCFPAQMKGALPFGDFSPGRYAWKLENLRPMNPFPVKGRQGLFEVEITEEQFRNWEAP